MTYKDVVYKLTNYMDETYFQKDWLQYQSQAHELLLVIDAETSNALVQVTYPCILATIEQVSTFLEPIKLW